MKVTNKSVITPEKLLEPFPLIHKPKRFKPTQLYLEEKKPRRNLLKQALPQIQMHTEFYEPNPIDVPLFNSFKLSRKSLEKPRFSLNRSCRLKNNMESAPPPLRDPFKIPILSYRNFEKSHSPNAKAKINFKTFSPKVLPVIIKEIPKEPQKDPTPEPIVRGPTRIEITEHSKELSSKLNRVSEIAKLVEIEHIGSETP